MYFVSSRGRQRKKEIIGAIQACEPLVAAFVEAWVFGGPCSGNFYCWDTSE